MEHAKETMPSLRHFEVQQVKSALRLEDTTNFAQGLFPVLAFEMVEHERGEDNIEAARFVLKLVCKSLIEPNRHSRPFSLFLCPCESLLVWIESNYFDHRKTLFHQHGKGSRSAAYVQHMLRGAKLRFIQQSLSCLIGSQDSRHEVIERQKQITARSREIRPSRFIHA